MRDRGFPLPMDDKQVESLIDNEREWRRYLAQEIREIRFEIGHQAKEIEALKMWTWVVRSVTVASFGALVAWIQHKLK